MSPSFPSLILEDPSKAVERAYQEVKVLCTGNHRTLLKEEETSNRNTVPYSQTGIFSVVDLPILLKVMYIYIETTYKIPCHFNKMEKKKSPKLRNPEETQRTKTVLRAKNNNGAFRLPEFKTGKNATAVKTVFYLQLNRQRDQ